MKPSDSPDRPGKPAYRGRLAPTPSGWLHLGHAATFTTAWRRARANAGTLIYRDEDLDRARWRREYAEGALADLRWWGLDWDEGPDCGGACAPYRQSERLDHYTRCMRQLSEAGQVYPSPESRRDVGAAAPATSPVDGEPLFPAGLRRTARLFNPTGGDPAVNWRFRVPEGTEIAFEDGCAGRQAFVAGRDFGDFLVWRRDGMPSYELAVVADDHAMGITEVVRGADLLVSTARQLLLYAAFGWTPPAWHHCPLVIDPATGRRMSKTHRSLGLRALRERGLPPGLPPEAYLKPAAQPS